MNVIDIDIDIFYICRYKDENVITFGLIPGPKKPKNLMSFLEPIYEEIRELGERGLVVKKMVKRSTAARST